MDVWGAVIQFVKWVVVIGVISALILAGMLTVTGAGQLLGSGVSEFTNGLDSNPVAGHPGELPVAVTNWGLGLLDAGGVSALGLLKTWVAFVVTLAAAWSAWRLSQAFIKT